MIPPEPLRFGVVQTLGVAQLPSATVVKVIKEDAS